MIALALKDLQRERPAYAASKDVSKKPGAEGWWAEVIGRTAVGAGSDPTGTSFYPTRVFRSDVLALTEVEKALPVITSKLVQRFSSREGYELYADTLSTCMFYFLIIAEGKQKMKNL